MIDQAQALREMAERQRNSNTKIITVTSGKGGVGKSSVALNMAIALRRKGLRVLIIDTDFGLANIDVMLGVNTRYDLLDVMKHQKNLRDIIEIGHEGVMFVSGGSGVYELTKMSTGQLLFFVNSLLVFDDIADVIIFDTGAGITDNILRLVQASHDTILVTTPEPTAVMDAYAMIKIVTENADKPSISLVLNKAENRKEAESVMEGLIRIAKKYTEIDLKNLGCIMCDNSMVKAVKMQVPVLVSFPRSMAAADIDRMVTKHLDLPPEETKRPGIVSFIDRFLQRSNPSLE